MMRRPIDLNALIAEAVELYVDQALEKRLATMKFHKPVLTAKEVEEEYGFKLQTLANKRVSGDGPPFFKDGRIIKYRREALERWIKSREVAHTH